jgi:hypothetical protein
VDTVDAVVAVDTVEAVVSVDTVVAVVSVVRVVAVVAVDALDAVVSVVIVVAVVAVDALDAVVAVDALDAVVAVDAVAVVEDEVLVGIMHPVSCGNAHMIPFQVMDPWQHLLEPPVQVWQPVPPHCPHVAAQHVTTPSTAAAMPNSESQNSA